MKNQQESCIQIAVLLNLMRELTKIKCSLALRKIQVNNSPNGAVDGLIRATFFSHSSCCNFKFDNQRRYENLF